MYSITKLKNIMKLKTEQIMLYLPYKLMCKAQDFENTLLEFQGISDYTWINLNETGKISGEQFDPEDVYPVLKPMQEAVNYFEKLYGCLEHQDVTDFFDADFLEEHDLGIEHMEEWSVNEIPYGTLKVLLKHHFDVFGLIPNKLAVDYKTVS